MGFCEEKGSGLDKVIFYNELYQLPPINVIVAENRTHVFIYSYKRLNNLDKKEKIRGTIKRFMEHLNPRAAHIVALEKPTECEQGEWYYQRYIKQLPTKGEMIFFDRSWYNPAGVERFSF